MQLPSYRETLNRLIVLVAVSACVFVATEFAKIALRNGAAAQVNWEDVNLSVPVAVPEEEVATARSAILKDFEAR